jgi:class 3 adenylate cyclase
VSTQDDRALEAAIARLQALRATLGDAAVDQAIVALRTSAVPSSPAPASPAAEGAAIQRRVRQVTILFADVANSTSLLGRVDTEDAMDLLAEAVGGFAETVEQWGGTVLRSAGDGIMAAFGLHGLREDEDERAVRTGLQILADAARHAERVERDLGVPGFGVRVGIHTGTVLIGPGPDAAHDVMGHAVHLAARMEQSAPIGRLRISDATWTAVRGLFDAEPQAPIVVKGHDEPLRTWLVREVVADSDGQAARGVEGVVTPTIGRDAELDRLAGLYTRCAATRRVGVATVIADAGIGKTRVRRELLRRIGLAEGAAGLLVARAQPSTELQPYGVLRALLARWLGIRDDLPAAEARARLVDGLAPWLGDDAPRHAARLGQLIGLDFADDPAVQALTAPALRDAAFDALRTVLLARAARAPLLLVLDDAHWADEGSLAFVRSLVRPAEAPLVVLLLARPSLRERGVVLDWPEGVEAEAVTLDPLPPASSLALLHALLASLPDAPESVVRLLLERAAGNPFYLEALVQMLVDDGVIDASLRPWCLHADRLANLRVPTTLVGVLQARLDALPADELRSLQQASIVGPVFWDAALAAVDAAAPPALPALRRRNLVSARERSAFTDTAENTFVHALLHDVTYDTVLKPQRREGHAAVARWLSERLSGREGEFLALAAQHYERAGDSARALEFWDRAQRDARRRYANDAALRFIERALAQPALTDRRWRYGLLAARHNILDDTGRQAEADAAMREMEAFSEQHDDDVLRADRLSSEMLKADHQGRLDDAARLARRILAFAARTHGDAMGPPAALAHGELAWLASVRHDYAAVAREVEAGMAHARAAARLDRRHGGYRGYGHQLRAIAITALLTEERYADVLVAVEAGLNEPDTTLRDRYSLLVRRSAAERQLGRIDAARATAEEAQVIAAATGVVRLRVGVAATLASATLWSRDLAATEAIVRDGLAAASALGLQYERLNLFVRAAELATVRDDRERVRQAWEQVLTLASELDMQADGRKARIMLARLLADDGAITEARAAIDSVLTEIASDPRPQHRALPPDALLACHHVLHAAGDPRAPSLRADLLARLDEQLAALPDDASREQLLRHVPHWGAVHTLR